MSDARGGSVATGPGPFAALVLRDLEVRGLARQLDRALQQLQRGDFRSAEVKKLAGAELYRAKLDDKNRLLFKIGEFGGRKVLLILEIVHNHDYGKARFLAGGSWRDDDFLPVEGAPTEAAASERLTYVNPASTRLHVLDKPLSFDDAQETVFAAALPLIVIGSAGSGKTALTLEKLKTLPGHGLYLTRSSYLVENARGLYFAHGYANDGQEVEFLSLGELLQTIDVPAGREARWADFASWFGRVRGSYKVREPHRLYEEINGVLTGAATDGPHLSEVDYLALGIRQSIFLGDERKTVFEIFSRWLAHLRETGLYDANIAAWERRALARPIYDFLVIDEVQDITNVELRLALATLRDKQRFLLSGDSNQIVHPNLFSWARVKSLFYAEGARDDSPIEHIHILSANYRNTRAVTGAANRLLLVKQRRFGSIDRESNYLVECVSDEPGRVDLVADAPEVRAEIDTRTRRSTRYAVVVLRDEDKEAARAAFSTPLVFSVREAKGLEYQHVVLFNLVSGAAGEFRECVAGVSPGELEGELAYARARDKTDKSLDAYKFYVNALYVAMTRAIDSLLIVESDPSHPLFALLMVDRRTDSLELAREESSREDWQREARRLELQGKTEQAEQIRREILEVQPVPWQVIDASSFAGIRERALGPGARDKAAQQLLFEYAVVYDAPGLFPRLVDAGFRHARKPDSGRDFIHHTHYAEYQLRRSMELERRVARYGVDFRNPLNETPLMVTARLARLDLMDELLSQGADPELVDTAGRTALRVALAAWLDRGRGRAGRDLKAAGFAAVFSRLAAAPVKVKVGARMNKLDPKAIEWFLLHLCLVQYRRGLPAVLPRGALPTFTAPTLATLLGQFPNEAVSERRKKRPYVSSILSKNEVSGGAPYNRRIFLRVAHGHYVLNPALEVEVKGEWIGVVELMGLPILFDTVGPAADYLRNWIERKRGQLAHGEAESGEGSAPAPS